METESPKVELSETIAEEEIAESEESTDDSDENIIYVSNANLD